MPGSNPIYLWPTVLTREPVVGCGMVLACPPHRMAAFQRYERATFLAPRNGKGIGSRTGGTKFEPGLPNRPSPVGATHKSTVPRTSTTSAPSLSAVAIYKLHAGPLYITSAPTSAKSVKSLAQGPWTSQKAAPTAPPSALSVKSLAQGPWTSQKAAPTAPLGGGTAPQLPRLPL
jgi:hypothetical protein